MRLLSLLPVVALVLVCWSVPLLPSVLHVEGASLSILAYSQDGCSDKLDTLLIGAADGSCVAINAALTSHNSAATILGFEGALYARAYCGVDPTLQVPLYLYSDAACANLIAARSQLATASFVCAQRMQFFCSAFTSNTTAPDWPPVGFATDTRCDKSCTDHCATLAIPANQCVATTSRVAPFSRSMQAVCVDTSSTWASYKTHGCTGAIDKATQQVVGSTAAACRYDRTTTCPSTFVATGAAAPTALPTLPGKADGYMVQKRGCASFACDVGCRVDVQPLASCTPRLTSAGLDSEQVLCSAGTAAINAVYAGANCAAGSASVAQILASDVSLSCTSTVGSISCLNTGAYAALPTFGAAFTIYEGSARCDPAAAEVTLIAPDRCVTVGLTSRRLNCPLSGLASLDLYTGGCATPPTRTIASNDANCTSLPGGSLRINCNYLMSGNGTTTAAPLEVGGGTVGQSSTGAATNTAQASWTVATLIALITMAATVG